MEEFEVEELTLEDLIFEPPFVDVNIKGKVKRFWLRPPSEMEKSMANNAARAQSRELRKRLEDPKTEEHKLLVLEELEALSDDELRVLWVAQRIFRKVFELSRTSLDNRDDYFVPEPEGKDGGVIPPTLEEMDRWEDQKEKEEKRRQKELRDQQEQITIALKTESEEQERPALVESVIPYLVDQHATTEWNAEYGMQLICRCTYLDKALNKPAFKTINIVKKLMLTPDGKDVAEKLVQSHMGMMAEPDKLRD